MLVAPRDEQVVGRDAVLASILSLLHSHRHCSQSILGPEGSGRTSLASALALEFSTIDSGPLRHFTVTLLTAEQILGAEHPGQWLREQVDSAGENTVVFIDDADVAATVGSQFGVNREFVIALRIVLQRKDRRIILTMDNNRAMELNDAFPGLLSDVYITTLDPLDEDTIMSIAEKYAPRLERHHGVSLNSWDLKNACGPKDADSRLEHPALGLTRIDQLLADAARGPVPASNSSLVQSGIGIGIWQEEHRFHPVRAKRAMRSVLKGQDHVVDAVIDHLGVGHAGLRLRPHRPLGVYLLAGPTGVGKTAFAYALAEQLFGTDSGVLRLDMSEYSERYSTSRLIGPSPGYLGSDHPEQWMTTKIIENPRRVLLLDEFEKAHPSVWQVFLQVFDAGRLTDGSGAVADFSETVIVVTSNLGAEAFQEGQGIGFVDRTADSSAQDERAVLRAIDQRLAPELVNRFDKTMVFHPLNAQSMLEITRKQVGRVCALATAKGFDLQFSEEAIRYLADAGYSRSYGARPLGRVIETLVMVPLSRMPRGRYRVVVQDGQLDFIDPDAQDG